MASQRKALIFSNGEMVIREILKYWITGTFVTLSILVGMNQAIAFQTSLPDTDVPIQMDSVFKATKIGINEYAFPGIKVRGNRIAWKKSVLTGKIEGETVYRFQKHWHCRLVCCPRLQVREQCLCLEKLRVCWVQHSPLQRLTAGKDL